MGATSANSLPRRASRAVDVSKRRDDTGQLSRDFLRWSSYDINSQPKRDRFDVFSTSAVQGRVI